MDDKTTMYLVDSIYEAALEPARWPVFLSQLGDVLAANTAMYIQDFEHPGTDISYSSGFEDQSLHNYVAHYSKIHPFSDELASLSTGTVATLEALTNQRDYERSEFYNDWMRPQGLYGGAHAVIFKNENVATNLGIARRTGSEQFDRSELNLLHLLTAHLQRAVRIHVKLTARLIERDAAASVLDGLSTGIILVARNGSVRYANRCAEGVLASGDALRLLHGCVAAASPKTTDRLLRQIAGAFDAANGRTAVPREVLRLDRRSGKQLSLLVCPLHETQKLFSASAQLAMVLITIPEDRPPLDLSTLRMVYGLTSAETILFGALVQGQRLKEFAETKGITLATAKTQLQQVFAKTGQTRQSDLIRVALTQPIARLTGELMVPPTSVDRR